MNTKGVLEEVDVGCSYGEHVAYNFSWKQDQGSVEKFASHLATI